MQDLVIDWSKAPEGATHYYQATEEWYLAGDGCVPRVWAGMWCKAFQFAQREHECIKRPTTPSWSGEGRPPVGVVCEANFVGEWKRFEMRYYGEAYVVFKTAFEVQRARYDFDTCGVKFRPVRTPEQIAADEREAAVNGMLCYDALGGSRRGLAEALYDAGYRKP